MGVSGSGKSSVGARLSRELRAVFLEGDSFHSEEARARMEAGRPLDDESRRGWLLALLDALQGEERAVMACSALKRKYRDVLRRAGDVFFVHLAVRCAHCRVFFL